MNKVIEDIQKDIKNLKSKFCCINSLVSLAGDENYILITANKLPEENAQELINGYTVAKTKTPYGEPLSDTNRYTVILAPGTYSFTSTFELDTPFIDIVTLTGETDAIFDLVGLTDPFVYDDIEYEITDVSYCLNINSDNIYVKGIKGQTYQSEAWSDYIADSLQTEYILPIDVQSDLPNTVIEKCIGGVFSFGSDFTGVVRRICSSTFIDCEAGFRSWSDMGEFTGTFIRCKGTRYSFISVEDLSGTFIDCEAIADSFNGNNIIATFKNCKVTEGYSFSCKGYNIGLYYNCTITEGGNSFFGNESLTENARCYNCITQESSFSGNFQLHYCVLATTGTTFNTVDGRGYTIFCVDGNGEANNQPMIII